MTKAKSPAPKAEPKKAEPKKTVKATTNDAKIPSRITYTELNKWLTENNIVVTDNTYDEQDSEDTSENESSEGGVYKITFDNTISKKYLDMIDQAAELQKKIDDLKDVMRSILEDNKAKVGQLDEKNRVYYKKDSEKKSWNALKLTQFIAAHNADVEDFKESKPVKGTYAFPKTRKR